MQFSTHYSVSLLQIIAATAQWRIRPIGEDRQMSARFCEYWTAAQTVHRTMTDRIYLPIDW